MACWGPNLYQNDVANDVKGYYEVQFHYGKTGPEITAEMEREFAAYIADPDDAPLFWFALADTQWNVGVLEPDVKEKALWYLANDNGLERWTENPTVYATRKRVLSDLQKKLSKPSKENKDTGNQFYQNNWMIGDVFSYRFESDYAKAKGFLGKKIYMVKVDETVWWPKHIIPIVYVFKLLSEEEVSLEYLRDCDYLPQFYVPEAYEEDPQLKRLYLLGLICSSEQELPKKQLMYHGNIGPIKRVKNEDSEAYKVAWKNFEEYIIENWCEWSE